MPVIYWVFSICQRKITSFKWKTLHSNVNHNSGSIRVNNQHLNTAQIEGFWTYRRFPVQKNQINGEMSHKVWHIHANTKPTGIHVLIYGTEYLHSFPCTKLMFHRLRYRWHRKSVARFFAAHLCIAWCMLNYYVIVAPSSIHSIAITVAANKHLCVFIWRLCGKYARSRFFRLILPIRRTVVTSEFGRTRVSAANFEFSMNFDEEAFDSIGTGI